MFFGLAKNYSIAKIVVVKITALKILLRKLFHRFENAVAKGYSVASKRRTWIFKHAAFLNPSSSLLATFFHCLFMPFRRFYASFSLFFFSFFLLLNHIIVFYKLNKTLCKLISVLIFQNSHVNISSIVKPLDWQIF